MDEPEQDLREALSALADDVHAFLRHHTGDPQVAADLAQEALARALISMETLRDRRALKGWLFRIAINRFNDHVRRRKEVALEEGEIPAGPPMARHGEPDREMLTRELDQVLREELLRLPERQRTVLMLHGIDGVRQRDIAELLGISVAAVKMSLYHGREALAGKLSRYLGRSLRGKGGSS